MPSSAVADAANKPSDEELAAGAPSVDQLTDADFSLPAEETTQETQTSQQADTSTDTTVEQVEQTTTETAAQRSLRERFADRQLNIPGNTDDEALDFIAQRVAPYAQIGQQVYPHLESFNRWLAEQENKSQPQQVEESVASALDDLLPKLPEYNEDWEKGIIRDEAGNVTGVQPWADPGLGQKVIAYERASAARARSILTNIDKIVVALAEPLARKIAGETAEQRFGVEHQNNFVRDIIQSNSDWLYVKDDQGRDVTGFNGAKQLTERGLKFAAAVKQCYEAGVNYPAMQARLAMQMIGPAPDKKQPDQVDPKVARQQQQFEQNRERASKKPNRGGSVPQPGHQQPPPQNEFQSFRQRAEKALEGFEKTDFATPI